MTQVETLPEPPQTYLDFKRLFPEVVEGHEALAPLFFVIVLLVGLGLTTPGPPEDDFLAGFGF